MPPLAGNDSDNSSHDRQDGPHERGGFEANGAVAGQRGGPRCQHFDPDMDYLTQAALVDVTDCFSADACKDHCNKEPRCGAWTWGEKRDVLGLTDTCFMKVLDEGTELHRVYKVGVISGLPCRGTGLQTATLALTVPTGPTTTPFAGDFAPGSLLCFELMQPSGYEKGLIEMQYSEGLSIFGCEEYAVYSSEVILIADGLMSRTVDSDLKCSYGGEFKTALNTQIFFAVWDKVIEDGRFRFHGWTVKVDPDCVFFPDRLRTVLRSHSVTDSKGVYLNNCRMGLHGPLEVFSREAIEVWHSGREQCLTYFTRLCSGDCFWGEDMFIDQCLDKVLKVQRDDEWQLLVEDHCDPPAGWQSCEDTSKVAFHPFKSNEGFRKCLAGSGVQSHVQLA